MNLKKIVSAGAVLALIAGCNFSGDDTTPEAGNADNSIASIDQAFDNTLSAESLSGMKSSSEIEFTFNGDIEGQKVGGSLKLVSEGQGGIASSESSMDLSLQLDNETTTMMEAQSGIGLKSVNGKAKIVSIDNTIYFMIEKGSAELTTDKVDLPAEYAGKWFYMDMAQMYAMSGQNSTLTPADMAGKSLKEIYTEVIIQSLKEQSITQISDADVRQIMDIVFTPSNYITFTSEGNNLYMDSFNWAGIKDMMMELKPIMEKTAPESISDEEYVGQVGALLAMAEAFIDENINYIEEIKIENNYITEYKGEISNKKQIVIPEGPTVNTASLRYSGSMSDFGKKFDIKAPEGAQDLQEMLLPLMMMGGMGSMGGGADGMDMYMGDDTMLPLEGMETMDYTEME